MREPKAMKRYRFNRAQTFLFFAAAFSLPGHGQANFDSAIVERVVENVECVMATPWHYVVGKRGH